MIILFSTAIMMMTVMTNLFIFNFIVVALLRIQLIDILMLKKMLNKIKIRITRGFKLIYEM